MAHPAAGPAQAPGRRRRPCRRWQTVPVQTQPTPDPSRADRTAAAAAAPAPATPFRPNAEQLAGAHGTTIADVTGPGLRVLFCGINPGLWSGATGYHFARPGNRFWPALHASGFTPERLTPQRQGELTALGLGITNVVARATAKADELTRDELREGGRLLGAKAERHRPRWIAVVGVTAYRTAFARPAARIGRQDERIGDSRVWVLPNPSGLNAHWSAQALAEEFGRCRAAALE